MIFFSLLLFASQYLWDLFYYYYLHYNICGLLFIFIVYIMVLVMFFFVVYLFCIPANRHFLTWVLAFAILICFITYILIVCHFFLFIIVWETILSSVSSPWFVELILRLVGCNNYLELLHSSIKNTQFVTKIDSNFFSCICHMLWWEIAFCIIACWIIYISEIRWAISATVDHLNIARINWIQSISFGNNNTLSVSSYKLLLDKTFVSTFLSHIWVSNIIIY